MARKIVCVTLLAAFVALLVVRIPICHSSEVGDAIFVSAAGQGGVYHKISGRVVTFTANELILEADNRQVLYERGVVRQVILDNTHPKGEQDIADLYWNQKESLIITLIVKAVQKTPLIGPVLSFLDNVSGNARMFLAILVLCGLLSYAAYKLYEMLVVATNLRSLNTAKLSMEVRKLRYELTTVEQELGLTPTMPVERLTAGEILGRVGAPFHFAVPQIRILDVVKFKILRMLTDEEIKRRTELWRKRWDALQQKPRWRGSVFYYFRMIVNVVGALLAGMFSLGSLADMIIFTFDPSILDANNSPHPLIGFVFVPFFIISTAFFLRLNAQRRIIRRTYQNIFIKENK